MANSYSNAILLLVDHCWVSVVNPTYNGNEAKTQWIIIMQYRRAKIEGGTYFFTSSRENKKEQTLWQRRFWEHYIENEQDLINQIEYIHYNPVKHGLVQFPREWKYSSAIASP